MGSRPDFTQAWNAFSRVHGDGSLDHVGQHIGGRVGLNIESGIFQNACALRMSFVLNTSGVRISAAAGATVSDNNGFLYLYRIRDLTEYLRKTFGPPDITLSNTNDARLENKKGILIFEVPIWNNATGHATLWNGYQCSDRCYFSQSSRILFWELI